MTMILYSRHPMAVYSHDATGSGAGFNVACIEAGLVETVEEEGRIVHKPKYRPYDLRHFFASMLIEKKTNLKKIQTLMGHTNIETTLNVYGHLVR